MLDCDQVKSISRWLMFANLDFWDSQHFSNRWSRSFLNGFGSSSSCKLPFDNVELIQPKLHLSIFLLTWMKVCWLWNSSWPSIKLNKISFCYAKTFEWQITHRMRHKQKTLISPKNFARMLSVFWNSRSRILLLTLLINIYWNVNIFHHILVLTILNWLTMRICVKGLVW